MSTGASEERKNVIELASILDPRESSKTTTRPNALNQIYPRKYLRKYFLLYSNMPYRRTYSTKRRPTTARKRYTRKKKIYRKPRMTLYKVPTPKVNSFNRETWLDMNFLAPGGQAWVASEASVNHVVPNADVLSSIGGKLYNMSCNSQVAGHQGDPQFSRVNWQPVFTMESLPGLEDLTNLFRLFKLHQVSITLYPMRATNPTQTAGAQPQTNSVSPNVIITSMYAKTGMQRLFLGGDDIAQVERKSTKLYNLGIGNKKLGWYFKPKSSALDFKNPNALKTPEVQIPDPAGPGTVSGVNLVDCFSFTVKSPQWANFQSNLDQEYFGPLISFRSTDGLSLISGGPANEQNNWQFRVRFKYYFSCKATK